MSVEEKDIFISKIIENVDLMLDRSYCAWFVDGSYIYISPKFQNLLGVDSSVLGVSQFLDSMRSVFSEFMMNIDIKDNRYIEFIPHKNVWLFVSFDAKCGMYVIQAINEYILCGNVCESIDDIPISIWLQDRDKKILYCNKKYTDSFGKTKTSIIKENLNFFASNNNAKMISQDNRIQKHIHNIVIGGQMRNIEVSQVCSGDNTVCVGIDITDNIANMQAYRNYKNSIETVLQHVSVAIAVFDVDMKLMFVNDAARSMFDIGYGQEINGYHIFDLVNIIADKFYIKSSYTAQDIKQYVKNICEFVETTLEPYSVVSQLISGVNLNIGIYPLKSVGTMVILEDISETISLKQTIKEMNQSSLQIIEYLNEGILVFGIDNRIRLINTTTKKIFNKDINESYIGAHISDFFEAVCDTQECLNTAAEIINIAYQRTPKYGRLPLNARVGIDYRYIPLSDGMHLLKFF